MIELKFYNTLTRRKEIFHSIESKKVRMYTCGPTVHDYAHLGNFRAYVFEDLLRRTLKYSGFNVTQVMNITDVEDKTILKSREEKVSLSNYTKKFKDAFFEDLDRLRIQRAEHYPAATDHIPEMIDLIEKLVDNGHTYEANGSIYFRISSFPEYGRLANVKPEGLMAGLRVDADEYGKEDVRDFALWKAWIPEDEDVFWEAPFGRGRPGWHIECSAMSTKYLGPHFDIHTGGVDNIFPHHENEIAQSVCGYGHEFVNYWMHNAHLIINGEKMSKSLGNFYTLRDILDDGISARAIRYFLLSAHYRQQLNLIYDPKAKKRDSFEAAEGALQRIDEFRTKLKEISELAASGDHISHNISKLLDKCRVDFEASLANDLDISGALAALFSMIKDANRLIDAGEVTPLDAEALDKRLLKWDEVLSILDEDNSSGLDRSRIEALIEERNSARERRDFARSDQIRDQLAAEGIILQDTPRGTRWRKK